MSDTVEHRPLSDHMNPLTEIISTTSLVVAGQLDTEILRVSFSKLVEKWSKLGTRIVKGKNVRLLLLFQQWITLINIPGHV